jgi:hypothetical protein
MINLKINEYENTISYNDQEINLIQLSFNDNKFYLDGFFKNQKCKKKYYAITFLKKIILDIIERNLFHDFNQNSSLYLDTECFESLTNYYKKLGFKIIEYNDEEDFYIMKIDSIKTLIQNINQL